MSALDNARAALSIVGRYPTYRETQISAALRDLIAEYERLTAPPTDDERDVLDLEDVREVFTASDRWDGDEAEQSIILRFIAHYSNLDREIDAARAADNYDDGAPIWFQWDGNSMSLVKRRRGAVTDEMVTAALARFNQDAPSYRARMRAALEAAREVQT